MDTLRIGKISSIDYPKGTARITYEDKGGSTTACFSFLAAEYWMPGIGDQVLIAHLSNGPSSAVILGPVWHDGHRPPEGFEGLYRKEYSNQTGMAYQRYDDSTGSWTLKVGGCSITVDSGGGISISAPSGVTVNTPNITVTGTVSVNGGSIEQQG